MKKITAALLCALLILGCFSAAGLGEDLSPDAVRSRILAMQEEYPEGMPWTNDNYYSWSAGVYSGGYGCAGFAFILSDAGFGKTLKARKITDIDYDALRVGDILRINGNTHSVVILEKHDDHVVIAEGNYNNSIHWFRTLTREKVLESDYYITRYPEADKGLLIDGSNFPDGAFRMIVSDCLDEDHNGYLSSAEISSVKELAIACEEISSLQGIELFSGLEKLDCRCNHLTSLDVSRNGKLNSLACDDNARAVTAENGQFDLSTLPGFDAGKASGWQGGTVNGTILTVAKSGDVKYNYDCGNGYSAAFTLNVTVKQSAPARLPGDATGDGVVDGRDVLRLMKYFAGQDVTFNEANADVTGDGVVDGRDVLRLMKYFAGQDVELK